MGSALDMTITAVMSYPSPLGTMFDVMHEW